MKKVLAVLRAERFSPNSTEKDKAIMTAVARRLQEQGHDVRLISEEQLAGVHDDYQVILSMGRLPETLAWLKRQSRAYVVNRPTGVEHCARGRLTQTMTDLGIPMAPSVRCQSGAERQPDHAALTGTGNGEAAKDGPTRRAKGYWIKRGDEAAQEKGDVQFAADVNELEHKISEFKARGITDYVVSEHVEGDLVKFYGVRGSAFFRYFYPTDSGDSKFGDEQRNGVAHHYAFSTAALSQATERLATAIGLDVYGGDCIVGSDGSFCLIDFNDWPSFARCREEAADAIAGLISRQAAADIGKPERQ